MSKWMVVEVDASVVARIGLVGKDVLDEVEVGDASAKSKEGEGQGV